ncbi:hypothetical protein PHYC_03306 [Phycisphaerales bacterium]|nr:hypothetical protein PHYC_03306 [Phycisphaerales bacterium]
MVISSSITIPTRPVEAFCRKWGVKELSLFGSALRADFSPDSDIDLLVEFLPGRGFTFDNTPEILHDAGSLFPGRRVDLVERSLIANPFRRHRILSTCQRIYVAPQA